MGQKIPGYWNPMSYPAEKLAGEFRVRRHAQANSDEPAWLEFPVNECEASFNFPPNKTKDLRIRNST
jgi:hypothetical protein